MLSHSDDAPVPSRGNLTCARPACCRQAVGRTSEGTGLVARFGNRK